MAPAIKYPYQVRRIIQYLSDPEHATHFLNQANIADISEIQDIHQYARTDGRRGLVINAKKKDYLTTHKYSST
jgi:hypothetical protein